MDGEEYVVGRDIYFQCDDESGSLRPDVVGSSSSAKKKSKKRSRKKKGGTKSAHSQIENMSLEEIVISNLESYAENTDNDINILEDKGKLDQYKSLQEQFLTAVMWRLSIVYIDYYINNAIDRTGSDATESERRAGLLKPEEILQFWNGLDAKTKRSLAQSSGEEIVRVLGEPSPIVTEDQLSILESILDEFSQASESILDRFVNNIVPIDRQFYIYESKRLCEVGPAVLQENRKSHGSSITQYGRQSNSTNILIPEGINNNDPEVVHTFLEANSDLKANIDWKITQKDTKDADQLISVSNLDACDDIFKMIFEPKDTVLDPKFMTYLQHSLGIDPNSLGTGVKCDKFAARPETREKALSDNDYSIDGVCVNEFGDDFPQSNTAQLLQSNYTNGLHQLSVDIAHNDGRGLAEIIEKLEITEKLTEEGSNSTSLPEAKDNGSDENNKLSASNRRIKTCAQLESEKSDTVDFPASDAESFLQQQNNSRTSDIADQKMNTDAQKSDKVVDVSDQSESLHSNFGISKVEACLIKETYVHLRIIFFELLKYKLLEKFRLHEAQMRNEQKQASKELTVNSSEDSTSQTPQKPKEKENKKKCKKLLARQQREEEAQRKALVEKMKIEAAKQKEAALKAKQLEMKRAREEDHRQKIEKRIAQLALEGKLSPASNEKSSTSKEQPSSYEGCNTVEQKKLSIDSKQHNNHQEDGNINVEFADEHKNSDRRNNFESVHLEQEKVLKQDESESDDISKMESEWDELRMLVNYDYETLLTKESAKVPESSLVSNESLVGSSSPAGSSYLTDLTEQLMGSRPINPLIATSQPLAGSMGTKPPHTPNLMRYKSTRLNVIDEPTLDLSQVLPGLSTNASKWNSVDNLDQVVPVSVHPSSGSTSNIHPYFGNEMPPPPTPPHPFLGESITKNPIIYRDNDLNMQENFCGSGISNNLSLESCSVPDPRFFYMQELPEQHQVSQPPPPSYPKCYTDSAIQAQRQQSFSCPQVESPMQPIVPPQYATKSPWMHEQKTLLDDKLLQATILGYQESMHLAVDGFVPSHMLFHAVQDKISARINQQDMFRAIKQMPTCEFLNDNVGLVTHIRF